MGTKVLITDLEVDFKGLENFTGKTIGFTTGKKG